MNGYSAIQIKSVKILIIAKEKDNNLRKMENCVVSCISMEFRDTSMLLFSWNSDDNYRRKEVRVWIRSLLKS